MEETKKAISSNAAHSTNYAMRVFYALAIVFVVAGHCSLNYPSGLNLGYNLFPVYSFHIPMFIFASGYFYSTRHEAHPVRYVLRKASRLLVPMFAIHAGFGWFCEFLAQHGFSGYAGKELSAYTVFVEPFLHDNMHMFCFDLAMWFLVPMFLAQCVYLAFHALVVRGTGRLRLALDTALLVCLLCPAIWVIGEFGTGPAHDGVAKDDMMRVYQTMFFLAFLAIGFYYRTYLERYADRIPDGVAIPVLLLAQLSLSFVYGGDLTMVVCWLGFPAGVAGTLLMGMTGTLFWLRVSKMLAPRLRDSWLVNEIGKNTFSIMAFHFVGFLLLNLVMYGIKQRTGGAMFSDFCDTTFFEGGVYYKCVPERMAQSGATTDAWGLLYVLAGIGVPLVLHRIWLVATAPVKALAGRLSSRGGAGCGKDGKDERADSTGGRPTGDATGEGEAGRIPTSASPTSGAAARRQTGNATGRHRVPTRRGAGSGSDKPCGPIPSEHRHAPRPKAADRRNGPAAKGE